LAQAKNTPSVKHLINALAITLFLSLASGQGILDFVELQDVPATGIPVLSYVNLISQLKFLECQSENLTLTEQLPCDFNVKSPFLSDVQAENAQEAIDEAWDTYYEAVARTVDEELNQKPYCYVPPICLPIAQPIPVPDPTCIATRLIAGSAKALAEHQPTFWADVNAALLQHLPNTVTWNGLPPLGTTTSAIFSVTPKLEQYFSTYSDDVREQPYLSNGLPPHISVPIPFTPEEGNWLTPGIQTLEDIKRNFVAATPLEYQNFGFATFYTLRSTVIPVTYLKATLLPPQVYPGVQIYCTAILVDIPLPIKLPTPTIIPTPVAITDTTSVAEGYAIPNTLGYPLAIDIAY
jgi:hypothetical protein